MMSLKYRIIIMLILAAGITACGAESADTPVNVSGILGTGYYTSPAGKVSGLRKQAGKAPLSDLYVDRVVALPVKTPFVATPEIMTDLVSADVADDGSFTITLDKERNWILLLIDSSKPRRDQIVSFAALGDSTAGSDSMILIPASDSVSDIDMGKLDNNGGDEASKVDSISENEKNFSLNISDLRNIARNDNILKTIKNIYMNYDPDTGTFYSAGIVFSWDVDITQTDNIFSHPDNYTLAGYQPSFNSRNDTSFPYEGVKNKDFIVKIVPPASVTDTNGNSYSFFSSNCALTESQWNPDSKSLWSNNPPFSFNINYTWDTDGWLQITASGCRFKNIVNGYWTIQKVAYSGGEEGPAEDKAVFDLGVCSPISTATGLPYVYMPSLKINTDENDNVTSFDIKWYIYNASTLTYEEVTDISGFSKLMEWVGISFNDLQNPGNSENCDFESVTTTRIYPEGSWKFTDTATSSTEDAFDIFAVRLGYRIYGVDFGINVTIK